MHIRRLAPVIAVALLAIAVAGHATAATAKRAASTARPTSKPAAKAAKPAPAPVAPAPPAAAPLAPGAAGMMIGIDPETGILGPPTAEQRLQLMASEEQMLSRSSLGLVERPIPGGGVILDLDGRFQEFSFIRLGLTGRHVFGCANDAVTLRRGLSTAQRPSTVYEER